MISAVKSEPVLLAIETSCDETAVAILRGNELLASEVASQSEHEAYGGVVPEVASRNHLLHAPRLLEQALEKPASRWKKSMRLRQHPDRVWRVR